MKITYFFRKQRPEYNSIEELFGGIIKRMEEKEEVDQVHVPLSGAKPWVLFKNVKFAKKHHGEINHITGDIQYIGIVLNDRTVLTIHDVYSVITGNWFKRWYLRYFWFYLPAKRVKLITTISEYSKNELVKVIPFASHKIKVVHNPYRLELLEKKRQWKGLKFELPATVLIVGTKKNKNLQRIIPALKDLNVKVRILGRLNAVIEDLLNENEIDYTNYFNLSYDEVIDLYLNSHILCFPSLYEGFGMPIIEAQALGIPVITSNLGAMKEVADGSACLVNPHDVNDIRDAVIRVMNNGNYRDFLIEQGYENIKRFDPEEIANQYLELYREIV